MRRVFVLGGTKPGYHKRYLRAIETLSEIFGEVYYQYADYKDNIPFSVPSNVYQLPVKLDRNELKKRGRITFEEKVKELFDEYGRDGYVYILDFLRFFPLYPFTHAYKVVFETFEYHPAGVLYSIPSYPFGKIKEWLLLPIYATMLDVSDGIVATAPRDVFPLNRKRGFSYDKVHFIPNLAATLIPPISKNQRRQSICYGATRKMSWKLMENVIEIWEKHGYVFDVFGGVKYDREISGKYYGFMPYEEYIRTLSQCKWVILTNTFPGYSPNINTLWSLPNKLFDALGAGTPVMVHKSNIAIAEFVERYGVGIVYNDHVGDELFEQAETKYDEILDNIRRNQKYFVWNDFKEKVYKEFLIRSYAL